MAHDVFISYSTRDKAIADAICASLERECMRCWIASRDVPIGAPFMTTIDKAISESQVMVLVFSAAANASQDVVREVRGAIEAGIPILPFRIENKSPSGDMRYMLRTIHWLDALTPPLELHIKQLVHRIHGLLVKPPHPTPSERQKKEPSSIWRGVLLCFAAMAFLAILALFLVHNLPRWRSSMGVTPKESREHLDKAKTGMLPVDVRPDETMKNDRPLTPTVQPVERAHISADKKDTGQLHQSPHGDGPSSNNGYPAQLHTSLGHVILSPEIIFGPTHLENEPGKGQTEWSIRLDSGVITNLPISSIRSVLILGKADATNELLKKIRITTENSLTYEGMSYNGSDIAMLLPRILTVDNQTIQLSDFLSSIDKYISPIPESWHKVFTPRMWVVGDDHYLQVYLHQVASINYKTR